jgi:hypothetical protein
VLRVTATVTRIGKRPVITEPKSAKARRAIPLSPALASRLLEGWNFAAVNPSAGAARIRVPKHGLPGWVSRTVGPLGARVRSFRVVTRLVAPAQAEPHLSRLARVAESQKGPVPNSSGRPPTRSMS